LRKLGNFAPLLWNVKKMIGRAHIHVRGPKADRYASCEDFPRIFSEESNGLYQLSFLLTGDPEKAERCFVSGFEDCATGNAVFHEWAHSWAKRTIIQNAIEESKPRPRHSNSPLSATIPDIDQPSSGPDGHFEIDAVLGLEDFERFVFVISVLEHYSEHDCTLLLGCSVQQFREARTRALRRIANSGGTALAREFLVGGESDRAGVVVEDAHETNR
jgi:DNA-directed RNA polymerase specialized sigma24 family protein